MRENANCNVVNEELHSEVADDFSRDVWCLFGFPVDNFTLESMCQVIERKIQANKKFVLSTININWLATSLFNYRFRATMINSDINVIDGVPLLWLSRMLDLPIREVIPGSTLIQTIRNQVFGTKQATIFFFGGDEGTGLLASRKLEKELKGLRPVGHLNPGYGSVNDFSKNDIISAINTQSPDILLVALGALKGQLWIEANKDRLDARLISHLGATINFLAGSLQRAPEWMQRHGIEWMWRIVKEPKLFMRYFSDGKAVMQTLLRNAINYALWRHVSKAYKYFPSIGADSMEITENESSMTLTLRAVHCAVDSESARENLYLAAKKKKDLILDFKKVVYLDNHFLALLLLLFKHQKRNQKSVKMVNVNKKTDRLLRLNMIDKSLHALELPLWGTI